MTCCRQWWPTVVKNIKFEWFSPLQFRIEGPRSSISDYGMKALWDKIGQISSKVAYNCRVFVTVSRYDGLVPSLSLHNLFWEVLWFSVVFDHILIKETRKRECGQQWFIIIQYVLLSRGVTNCGHIWTSIANSDQFSTSAPEKATYELWRHLVADNA